MSEIPSPPAEVTAVTEPPAPRRGRWWPVLLVLVVFAAAAAAGFVWLERERLRLDRAAGAERAALENRFATLSAELARLADEYRNFTATRGALDARTDELSKAVARLSERQDPTDLGRSLAEIEYVVVTADERLRLDRDIGSAIAALEAADRRAGELDAPTFATLRAQLAADLDSLRAVPRPDVSALAVQLAALAAAADALPLRQIQFDVERVEPAVGAADWFRRLPANVWREIVGLVEIKRMDGTDAVLADPTRRQHVAGEIQMELIAARVAVMRRDTANLHASAKLVRTLAQAYLDTGDPGVKRLLETLGRLEKVELAPSIPTLDGSLNAIRQLRAAD
ncbi:MAG: uroporphyrinogen-III C-methyltransferase [Gammaproteobacteria bacterium]